MNGATRRWKPRVTFFIKLLFVLIFPLEGIFSVVNMSWTSILLIINETSIVTFSSVLSVVLGLVFILPGVVFERQLNLMPISKSIRKRILSVCILIWFTSYLLLIFGGNIWRVYDVYETLVYAPILSISFYVVLPVISRSSTMQRIPIEYRTLSYSFIKTNLHTKNRRQRLLSSVLWIGLMFSPFMMFIMSSWWSYDFHFFSLSYYLSIYGRSPWLTDIQWLADLSFEYLTITTDVFPVFVLLSSLRLVFVRDVFRYQNGLVDKSRLASIAVLGEILPSALVTLSMLITGYPGDLIPVILPFPLLSIIGFAHIRFSKVIQLKDELWSDYEYRMWFEEEPREPEPMEESITVPLAYLLLSHFRKRRNDD